MRVTQRIAVVLLFLIPMLALGAPVRAQSADILYFPETGHNVKGDFLTYYKSVHDPKLLFGYPITEQITSKDGKTVQYFQRARFELTASSSAKVKLTALGQSLYKSGSQQLNINNSSGCETFPTGFGVCFAFLDFYKLNGGATQFGNPISPFEFRENLIVQYFEKARFEWRADRPEDQRVVITDLGRLYFDQLAEDQARLKPVTPLDATINNVLSINARAYVLKAVTLSRGQQTVYVIVQSQTHQAISNANGKVTIRFPDGKTEDYFFSTNTSGVGSITFSFSNQKQGELVPIDVLVTYQGLSATTTTSFRIWY